MYKQVIIVRKDLNMSPGKLSAQVSHASMAFLTNMIRLTATPVTNSDVMPPGIQAEDPYGICCYNCDFYLGKDIYEKWINDSFTKIVLQARNKNHLMKAVDLASELGMMEGYDYFLIRDNCLTELKPEEDGRTLTCIGFRPMWSGTIDKIGKKYHLLM